MMNALTTRVSISWVGTWNLHHVVFFDMRSLAQTRRSLPIVKFSGVGSRQQRQ